MVVVVEIQDQMRLLEEILYLMIIKQVKNLRTRSSAEQAGGARKSARERIAQRRAARAAALDPMIEALSMFRDNGMIGNLSGESKNHLEEFSRGREGVTVEQFKAEILAYARAQKGAIAQQLNPLFAAGGLVQRAANLELQLYAKKHQLGLAALREGVELLDPIATGELNNDQSDRPLGREFAGRSAHLREEEVEGFRATFVAQNGGARKDRIAFLEREGVEVPEGATVESLQEEYAELERQFADARDARRAAQRENSERIERSRQLVYLIRFLTR